MTLKNNSSQTYIPCLKPKIIQSSSHEPRAMSLRRFDAESSSSRSRSPRPQSSSQQSSTNGESEYSTSSESLDDESENMNVKADQPVVTVANLMVSLLTAFHGEEIKDDDASTAALNGRCPKRLERALKDPCGSGCALQCRKHLRHFNCKQCVDLFWGLNKTAQDCLLWSMQQSGRRESF